MRILARYIARYVLSSVLLALLLLVALDSLFDTVAELNAVGRGSYGVPQVLQYILLTIPSRIQLMLPMAALLGSLIGMGMLASHGELTVMRAAGISILRITSAVLYVGVLLMVLAVIIGEYVTPPTSQLARTLRASAITDGVVMSKDHSFWARDDRSFINIRHIHPGGRLSGIYIYDFDAQHRLAVATYAEIAQFDSSGWSLQQVKRSIFGSDGVQTERLEGAVWKTRLTPEVLNVVVVKPEELSIRDLYRYVAYLHDNQLDTERYELAFWSNIAAPLTSLVMLLIAVPFVFGPLRSVSAGLRVVVGVLAGVGFYLVNQTTTQFAQVYDLNPMISALLPMLLFASVSLWMMRRVG